MGRVRPPSRRLAPRGRNRQAASPRPSGGGVRGPERPPLPPPPRPKSGRRPTGETAAPHPREEAAAPRGGDTAAAASAAACQAAPVNRPHAPTLPAADRPRNGGAQDGANGAAHSEAGLGKAGARTRVGRSHPPSPPPPAALTHWQLTGPRPTPTAARQPPQHEHTPGGRAGDKG